MTTLDQCLAYLEKLPNAVEGSHGHRATHAAALVCRRFGLSEGEMWQAMTWFNENRCLPPWSEKELRHKMASVADLAVNRPLGRSTGRRSTPKPVTADALRQRMAERGKVAPVPMQDRGEAEEAAWWAQVAAARGVSLEIRDGEPPEAPPPLDDGPLAEYWGWPPISAPLSSAKAT